MPLKLRVRKNTWDNWYGYRGNRRVIDFGATPYETQEQMANRWLAEGGPEDFKRIPAVVVFDDRQGEASRIPYGTPVETSKGHGTVMGSEEKPSGAVVYYVRIGHHQEIVGDDDVRPTKNSLNIKTNLT